MDESTPKRKKIPAGLIAGIAAAAVAVAVAAGYFGLCAWVRDNGLLLPGAVAVDEKGEAVADLGRMSREDAVATLSQEMDQRLSSRKLTLHYGDNRALEFTGELLACSPEAAVDVGFAAKDEQPFWNLAALWLGMDRQSTDLSVSAAAFTQGGEQKARWMIQAVADELYKAPVDFTYEVGEEAVEVTPGSDGQRVDADALLERVEQALAQGLTELTVEPEPVPGAELSGQVLHDLIHVDPKPAGKDENGRLTPAVIGLSVDAQEAQGILDQAEPGQSCSIPLVFTPPGVSGDESMYYQDLLSSVQTHVDGDVNRAYNVNLAAQRCNGKVIQPGEVFSYLGTIDINRGYRTGTGYQGGLTVPMGGGGVCQVSSSIYYCAVYANLEIVKRACHAFSTGYIPNGLDATVYAPGLDFKFRNNSGYPIKIVAYVANRTLTVQLYGSNPDGIKVETERYTNSTTPWTTVYRADQSVPRGTTVVDVTPYTGYDVDVYRCVYDANGNRISRTHENHSHYSKRDKVVLYNPADEGPWGPAIGVTDPPEPSQDPWVDPTPSQDPWVEPTPSQDPGVDPSPFQDPGPTDSPFIDLPSAEPSPSDDWLGVGA